MLKKVTMKENTGLSLLPTAERILFPHTTEHRLLGYDGTCETRAKELALQFITGENDINDDDAWEDYIDDIKSQTDEDFDEILETLNEKTVK